MRNLYLKLSGFIVVLFFPFLAISQEMGEIMKGGSCPMCGTMGWAGMVLGGLLLIAVIAVLFSLALFLYRRSRPHAEQIGHSNEKQLRT